ncbi:MAG: hypothetical protein ACM3UZ_08870 [Acidobacteriota bacterium]
MAALDTAEKSIFDVFKKFRSILITMAVVVVVSGVISYALDRSSGPSGDSPWYSVLPETAHNLNGADATPLEPEKISGSIVLTGTIIDPAGNNTAILEAGNNSYIASLGSSVGDMKVVEITGSSLTLAGDQGAKQLEMRGGVKNTEGNGLSINFNKANFRDAASALALISGYTVLISEDASARIDYHNNADSLKSLESIAQKQGFAASRKGNVVVIAKAGTLQQDLFNQVIKFKFNLKYMTAQDLYALIDDNKDAFGISPTIDPMSPHQIRFVGKVQSVDKVREMIALCDVPDGGTIQSKTLVVKNIAPDKAVEMLAKAGIPLAKYVTLGNTIMVFDPAYFNKWAEVESLLSNFDVPSASGSTIVLMRLKYITADDASTALAQFNIGNGAVKTISAGNSKVNKDMMVVCPKEMESQVKAALNTIDTSREAVKLPVLTATGSDATNTCRAKMAEISSKTGIAEDRMYISSDLAGGSSANNRLYVLWINDKPENIKKVQDIIGQI